MSKAYLPRDGRYITGFEFSHIFLVTVLEAGCAIFGFASTKASPRVVNLHGTLYANYVKISTIRKSCIDNKSVQEASRFLAH